MIYIVDVMLWRSSHRATYVARKLIEGVFRKELHLHLTLSGLPARAQSKEHQNVKVSMMNLTARNAIVGKLTLFQQNIYIFFFSFQ